LSVPPKLLNQVSVSLIRKVSQQ